MRHCWFDYLAVLPCLRLNLYAAWKAGAGSAIFGGGQVGTTFWALHRVFRMLYLTPPSPFCVWEGGDGSVGLGGGQVGAARDLQPEWSAPGAAPRLCCPDLRLLLYYMAGKRARLIVFRQQLARGRWAGV